MLYPARKIAVLRNAGLGDLMFCIPALQTLRDSYPEAEIVLLGEAWHQDLLLSRPSPVDRVVTVPGGVSALQNGVDLTELEPFFRQMQEEKFDVALQLFGGGRHSNSFIGRLGAALTVGARTADAGPLDRWIPYVYYQSETFRCLEICSLLGLEWASVQPKLAVTKADLAEARGVVAAPDPLVAIHPGAGSPRRRWGAESFAALADELLRAGATVVVTGVQEEREVVSAVIERMHQKAINLCGRLSLGGLAGLLSNCRVVISNDSGPLHLAQAVGAATVGIYWCGNVINGAPLTRARYRPAISWTLDCPVCGLNCMQAECEHQESFVGEVPVEEVLEHALDLLEKDLGGRRTSWPM